MSTNRDRNETWRKSGETLRATALGSWRGLIFWLLLVGLLALYPYSGVSSLTLFIGSQIFVLVTLASNWNLIGGMTGYVDFGHAVFFRHRCICHGHRRDPVPAADLPGMELLAGPTT